MGEVSERRNPWEIAEAARLAVMNLLGPSMRVIVEVVGESPGDGGTLKLRWERAAEVLTEVVPGVVELPL